MVQMSSKFPGVGGERRSERSLARCAGEASLKDSKWTAATPGARWGKRRFRPGPLKPTQACRHPLPEAPAGARNFPSGFAFGKWRDEPAHAREFAEGSMACAVVAAGDESPLSDRCDLRAGRLAEAVRSQSEACLPLSNFRTAGRESVAPALLNHRSALPRRRPGVRPDTSTAD